MINPYPSPLPPSKYAEKHFYLWDPFNLVWRLLKLPDLPDDVGDLRQERVSTGMKQATTTIVDSILTILIFAKLSRPFSVKLGVPSSMKVRSERYIPCHRQSGSIRIVTTRDIYLLLRRYR